MNKSRFLQLMVRKNYKRVVNVSKKKVKKKKEEEEEEDSQINKQKIQNIF